MKRVSIAQNTLEILEAGSYTAPSGTQVNIRAEIQDCTDRTIYYDPETLSNIQQDILSRAPQFSTHIELKSETTLEGIQRLAGQFEKIGVLNFASAKNPGGGFRTGAQAQEESLARSSALYQSLLKGWEYYEFHRAHRSTLYSDRMIYSPNCPVFKAELLKGEFQGRFRFISFSIYDSSKNQSVLSAFQRQFESVA